MIILVRLYFGCGYARDSGGGNAGDGRGDNADGGDGDSADDGRGEQWWRWQCRDVSCCASLNVCMKLLFIFSG